MVSEFSFSEPEKNFGMAVVDTIVCVLGLLTGILGIWVEGPSVMLIAIIPISLLMGFAGFVRFRRERDMSTCDLPSPWRTP